MLIMVKILFLYQPSIFFFFFLMFTSTRVLQFQSTNKPLQSYENQEDKLTYIRQTNNKKPTLLVGLEPRNSKVPGLLLAILAKASLAE